MADAVRRANEARVFWFVPYRIPFDDYPSAATEKLRRMLSESRWERLIATFSGLDVKIQHKLPLMFQNSWNPIFCGKFVSRSNGSELVGHFRIHWLVFVFMLIFLATCIFQIYDTWSQPDQQTGYVEGWKEYRLRFELQFLGLFFLMNCIGWLVGIPYQRKILAAIRESANNA